MPRPAETDYAPFYANYVAHVPEADVMAAMVGQHQDVISLLKSVPESEAGICHPPYTWTIRQVLGHLIDGERVFSYRALRFARGDETPLPSFEEQIYVRNGDFDRLALADLIEEFDAVRKATILLFHHMPDDAWTRRGIASDSPVTVNALAYIIVGHVRHHLGIVRTRLKRT